MLIHHNTIRDVAGDAPTLACEYQQASRIGINIQGPALVWRSVLYANTCRNVSVPLVDRGLATIQLCEPAVPDACECATPSTTRSLH